MLIRIRRRRCGKYELAIVINRVQIHSTGTIHSIQITNNTITAILIVHIAIASAGSIAVLNNGAGHDHIARLGMIVIVLVVEANNHVMIVQMTTVEIEMMLLIIQHHNGAIS